MLIRITRELRGEVDGIDLSRLQKGSTYALTSRLANFLITEHWGTPIDEPAEPSLVVPLSQIQPTVLVVDDDEQIRHMLRALLTHNGFAVVEARNGGEALTSLVRHRPAVVLLDLQMPGMGGDEFREAQQLLLDQRLVSTPVIVVSALDDARERGERLGAVAVIEKPLDVERVLAAVHTYVDSPLRDHRIGV